MKRTSAGVAVWSGFGVVALLVGCDPPPLAGRGGECNSLSDCKPGLVCVEDRCTDDLTAIAGEVPAFAEDEGDQAE